MKKLSEAANNIADMIGGISTEVIHHMARGFGQAASFTLSIGGRMRHGLGALFAPVLGISAGAVMGPTDGIVTLTSAFAGVATAGVVTLLGEALGNKISEMAQCRSEIIPYKNQKNLEKVGVAFFCAVTTLSGVGAAHATHKLFSYKSGADSNDSPQEIRDTFSIQTSDKGGCVVVLTGHPQTAEVTFGDCKVTRDLR